MSVSIFFNTSDVCVPIRSKYADATVTFYGGRCSLFSVLDESMRYVGASQVGTYNISVIQ